MSSNVVQVTDLQDAVNLLLQRGNDLFYCPTMQTKAPPKKEEVNTSAAVAEQVAAPSPNTEEEFEFI
jgi:hypothetical protein